MTLSSEQFHTLYNGAAQPVILVRDGAVAELNCHAQELFAVGTALRAYLPQDAALPEMLYARPAVLPVMAGGVCVSANTQPLDDALLLFLPPQDTRDELAAFCRAAQSISTPLTTLLSVSGTLFPLLSEAEDPAVQQNLAVLNRACYQLLRASENLTDLSYVQHGRLPLSLEKTDLTDFLDGLAQRADELCRQMGLALEVDLPQAPIFVWIDRRQVRRALLALLSNAVKFSAPGGTLHLTLTRHGRRAVIRLSDSGEGMDAEILCSAFHRYARPEVPEDSRFGAGFSLPVVQAIMQAHGDVTTPVVNMLIGGVVKVIVNYFLVAVPSLNIVGAAIGTLTCYAVITALDLVAIRRRISTKPRVLRNMLRPALAAVLMGAVTFGAYRLACHALSPKIACLLALVIAVVCYAVLVVLLRCITYQDCLLLPKGEKIAKLLHLREKS